MLAHAYSGWRPLTVLQGTLDELHLVVVGSNSIIQQIHETTNVIEYFEWLGSGGALHHWGMLFEHNTPLTDIVQTGSLFAWKYAVGDHHRDHIAWLWTIVFYVNSCATWPCPSQWWDAWLHTSKRLEYSNWLTPPWRYGWRGGTSLHCALNPTVMWLLGTDVWPRDQAVMWFDFYVLSMTMPSHVRLAQLHVTDNWPWKRAAMWLDHVCYLYVLSKTILSRDRLTQLHVTDNWPGNRVVTWLVHLCCPCVPILDTGGVALCKTTKPTIPHPIGIVGVLAACHWWTQLMLTQLKHIHLIPFIWSVLYNTHNLIILEGLEN